jgi:hypothetical protein
MFTIFLLPFDTPPVSLSRVAVGLDRTGWVTQGLAGVLLTDSFTDAMYSSKFWKKKVSSSLLGVG